MLSVTTVVLLKTSKKSNSTFRLASKFDTVIKEDTFTAIQIT